MHATLRFASLMVFFTSLTAYSQIFPGLGALDVPTDPRSTAMGESMVALPSNQAGLMSNPAGLADVNGILTKYANRENHFSNYAEGARMQSGYVSVSTSLGTIAGLYNRSSFGDIPVTDAPHPTSTGQVINLHEDLYEVGVAHKFSEHWSAGFAVKTLSVYDYMPQYFTVTQHPFLVDFGLLFSLPEIFPGTHHRDRLSVGLSAQNMGSDYRFKWKNTNWYSNQESDITIPVPRYVRLGFSYEIVRVADRSGGLSPAGLLVTAEYRGLTNPSALGQDPSSRDFWGVGVELSAFEIVKARLGGYAQPYTNLYGDKGTLKARYGAGVALPLERIGVDLPLIIGADYANVPVNLHTSEPTTLNAFSLTLQLDTTVF